MAMGTPGEARLAADVTYRDLHAADLDHAKHNRQIEASRPDRARVEHRDAAVVGCERDVRVTAHHEARFLPGGEATDIRAQSDPGNGDVHEEEAQEAPGFVTDLERQGVGQLTRVPIDVAADCVHRGDLFERSEDAEVADVTCVQDVLRLLGHEQLRQSRVRPAVRVGDDGDPERPAPRHELASLNAGDFDCLGFSA
jgi:hypothetical protein